MAKNMRRPPSRRYKSKVTRYTAKTLRRDREYGFFWYSGLWRVIRPVLVFLCALIILAGLVFTGVNKVNEMFFMAVEPGNTDRVDFTISSGSSVTTIGQNLYDAGLIRNRGIFRYIIQFKGLTSKIQYGYYPLSRDMDVNQIIDVLCKGSATNERTITIIPGWTVEDIAAYLKNQGALTDTVAFLALCNDMERFQDVSYSLQYALEIGNLKERTYQLEGYLAPDTYRVYLNATPESIIQTLLEQNDVVMDSVFNIGPEVEIIRDETGQIISGEEAEEDQEVRFVTTLNQDETLILASIIEKEAGRRSDYAKVSAVLHNRLERNMALESDATVAYPLGVSRMILTADELATVNGYNTYTKTGLPVGPICNPSKAAIQAALYPDTEYIYDGYLYFCAGDPAQNELLFSKTREEHRAYVRQYRPLWEAFDRAQNQSG
jgi:UPF0755 protein